MSKYVVVIYVFMIFLLSSCQNSTENIKSIDVSDGTICGQNFLKESHDCPQDHFILMKYHHGEYPRKGLWLNTFLTTSRVSVYPKPYLVSEPKGLRDMYDNLPLGTYDMHYVSVFKDTLTQKILFKENIEISTPEYVLNEYTYVDAEELGITKLKNGDVLQLAYQEVSCFPSDRDRFYEFMYKNDSVFVTATSMTIDGFMNRGNDWKSLPVKDFNKQLVKLVQVLKANTDQDCSTIGTYTFKKKNSRIVYQVVDGSCEIDGLHILNL